MRPVLLASLALAGLSVMPSAHADTVYDLVFTGSAGTVIGDGSLTLNTAPPAGNSSFYEAAAPGNAGYTITGFSATVDGSVFNLANESQLTTAMFSGSILTDLEYADLPAPPDFYGEVFFSTYSGNGFQILNTLAPYPNDSGTFTATEVTPEPASLALLGTGLLGGLGVVRGRFR